MIAGAARHVPGLRRLPVGELLIAGEVVLLARDHVRKLDGHERRRLVELVRVGHGRPRNLSPEERNELAGLVAKAQPGLFLGTAARRLSPVPIPHRLLRTLGAR